MLATVAAANMMRVQCQAATKCAKTSHLLLATGQTMKTVAK